MTGNDLKTWFRTRQAPQRTRLAADLRVAESTVYKWQRRGDDRLDGPVELAIKAWKEGIRLDDDPASA